MKKRLLIISLFLTIFLTGCNVEYSLEIKDEKIKEKLSVVETDSELFDKKDDTDNSFYDYTKIYGEESNINTDYNGLYSQEKCDNCSYYDKKVINDNGLLGFELSHEFTFDEYTFSSIANEMIPAFSSTYDGRYLRISGGPLNNYYENYDSLKEFEIKINTNYKVTSTNLEIEDYGKYKWVGNNKDEKLFIVLDTSEIVETPEDENRDILIFLFIMVGGLIIALICMTINKRKK